MALGGGVRVATGIGWRALIKRIDGAPVFDVMLQHKSLQEDMTELAHRLGVSLPTLPRAKSGFRTDRRPAHLILNDDQKRRIRELAAFEFETFGYLP